MESDLDEATGLQALSPPHRFDPMKTMYVSTRSVFDLLKGHEFFIAGGFLRAVVSKEETADIDCFFPSERARDAAGKALTKLGSNTRRIW